MHRLPAFAADKNSNESTIPRNFMLTDRTSKPPLKMITNDYNDYKKRNEGKSKRWAFYKVVTASH